MPEWILGLTPLLLNLFEKILVTLWHFLFYWSPLVIMLIDEYISNIFLKKAFCCELELKVNETVQFLSDSFRSTAHANTDVRFFCTSPYKTNRSIRVEGRWSKPKFSLLVVTNCRRKWLGRRFQSVTLETGLTLEIFIRGIIVERVIIKFYKFYLLRVISSTSHIRGIRW